MPTLFFPERETLRLVLASGSVAAPVTQTPATAGWDEKDRLWLTTNAVLPHETTIALQRFGVRVVGSSAAAATETLACWQQLLPLTSIPESAQVLTGAVLFDAPGSEFSSLVGEIERCSGKSCGYRWLDDIADDNGCDRVLVKTDAPPYFTLLRAGDRASIRAYVEPSPRVWVAVGWQHPFASQIQPPAGKMLLLRSPRIWEWLDESDFQNAASSESEVAISHAEVNQNSRTGSPVGRGAGQASMPIPLRLVETEDSIPAELWIVRDEAFLWLERFLQAADEGLLHRFTCAVASSDADPALVLRARGKGPTPILVDAPTGYRPLLKLANLYVPCGRMLAPLPRRDTIRELLANHPKKLTWLRALEGGAFSVESVALSAFRPLPEFVEYRLERSPQALAAWVQSSAWDMERFVERAVEPAVPIRRAAAEQPRQKQAPRKKEARDNKPRERGWLARAVGWMFQSRPHKDQPATALTEDPPLISIDDAVRTALPSPLSRTIGQALKLDEAKGRANALAARFHESLDEMTASKRLELWPEIAAAFAQANQSSEAALSWLNALWEQDRPSPLWAWGWFKAEAAQAGWNPHEADWNRWLIALPDKHRPRAVAAFAFWSALQQVPPKDFAPNATRINAYLDAHEAALPIRAAWLVRTALARSARGDVLALAHTRDRLIARLHDQGLSLASDVPSFIRSAGSDDPDRLMQVGKWLTAKRKTIAEWIGALGPGPAPGGAEQRLSSLYELEAEIPCTQAYANLMIAWGLSRLGEHNEAGRLRDLAQPALPEADPIHAFLRSAFDFRLQEARENRAPSSLPLHLQTQLDALAPNDRYRVDRLRQRSRILEPLERIDVWWASTMQHFRGWDDLRRQLIELPRLERSELNRRVKALLERFDRDEAGARPIVLLAILELANRVERACVEIVLDRALGLPANPPALFLRVLERGLQAAAALGLDGKVRLFAHRFAGYVEEQKGQASPALLEGFEGLTSQSFRCLRKFGMKEEADKVLSKIALWLTRDKDLRELRQARAGDWPVLLRTLLHVAASWYYCGRGAQGHRIIEEARTKDLFDYESSMSLPDRTALALAYAGAIAQIPANIAQGCFEELFLRLKRIAVTGYSTHYTLQPLELIDTVVRAVVSDDFALGPAVRGWLDDDEYNVRQRIHREMKEWMDQQGV